MSIDAKCSIIEVCPFLSVVEFCPYESASDLLAYGSIDSLCLCSLNLQATGNPNSATQVLSSNILQSHENLITFDYKGVTCISWSPITNIRYLPRCAKIAFGMENSTVCVLTTDFKEDTKAIIFQGHKKSVNSVAFEPTSGDKLASVSDDHTCLIWNVENGEIVTTITLLHAGVNVCWNVSEPGKLMIAEQSGKIRFYDLEDSEEGNTAQPILCLESFNGTLTSCHWCPSNPLRVGAVIGNEWILWNISNSLLPEESRQAHSAGCTNFRWAHNNEDVFLTQGRPKHTIKFHHLGHRELLFQDVNMGGSGASWHINLPICAVAANKQIKFYNLSSLIQP